MRFQVARICTARDESIALKRHQDTFAYPAQAAVKALSLFGAKARLMIQPLIELGSDETAAEDLRQAAREAAIAIDGQ